MFNTSKTYDEIVRAYAEAAGGTQVSDKAEEPSVKAHSPGTNGKDKPYGPGYMDDDVPI